MNVATTNQSDHVFDVYVHGLLLNMEMCIARHCSSSHSPSNEIVIFTPKNGQSHNSNRGGGRQGSKVVVPPF